MELLQEPSTQVRPSVYMSFACCDLRQIYVPFVWVTGAIGDDEIPAFQRLSRCNLVQTTLGKVAGRILD